MSTAKTLWDYWHSFPPTGQATVLGAIIAATLAGLYGILHALLKDHPKAGLKFGASLLLAFAAIGLYLAAAYKPAPQQLLQNQQTAAQLEKKEEKPSGNHDGESKQKIEAIEKDHPKEKKTSNGHNKDTVQKAFDWFQSPPSHK